MGAFMRRTDFFLFAGMLGSLESGRPVEASLAHRGQHFVFDTRRWRCIRRWSGDDEHRRVASSMKETRKKDSTKMSEPREAFMDDHCGRICSSPVLVAAFAVLILAGPAYGQGKAPDFSGTYWASQYNAKVQLVGGGELPLTAKGKEAYEKNM